MMEIDMTAPNAEAVDTRLDQILTQIADIKLQLADHPKRTEVTAMVNSIVDERMKAYLTAVETQTRIDTAVNTMTTKTTEAFQLQVTKVTDELRRQANGMINSFSVNTREIQESFKAGLKEAHDHLMKYEDRVESIRTLHMQSIASNQDLIGRLEHHTTSVGAKLDMLSAKLEEDALRPITDLNTFKAQLETERIRRDAQWGLVKNGWSLLQANKWLLIPLLGAVAVAAYAFYPDVVLALLNLLRGVQP